MEDVVKPKVIIVAVIVSLVALFSYTACENEPAPPGFVGTWVYEEEYYEEEYYGSKFVTTLTLTENSLQLTYSITGEGEYGYYKILFSGVRANIEVSGNTMILSITEIYSFYIEGWIDNTDPEWDDIMYYYYYYGYSDSITWTFNIEGDTLTLDYAGEAIVFTRQ